MSLIDLFFGLLFVIVILGIALLAAHIDRKTTKNEINYAETDLDKKRQVTNVIILQLLADYAAKNPSQRFGQILRNTGVVVEVGVRDSAQQEWETPDYYWARGVHEEPEITLKRMIQTQIGVFKEIKVVDNR